MSKRSSKAALRRAAGDTGVILAATLLYSAGMGMFLEPARLIMGGMTGLATAINLLFGFPPIGTATLILNIPLLLIVWKVYGFRFILRTTVATVAVSLGMDIFTFWPVEQLSPLLCAVFGGITTGAAIGLLFSRGYNTGGTDLIVYLLRRKWKQLTPAGIIFATDCLIIAFSALTLRDFTLIFYSAVTIYVQSKALELVMNGFHRGRAVFIISEKEKEIAKALTEELERGVTVLAGRGYFSGERREVLLCAIQPRQVYKLKILVKRLDPDAFLIITDAAEISGFGFEKAEI